MADRAVCKTGEDDEGDITWLCSDGTYWSPRGKWGAIQDIESGAHTYHVPWRDGPRRFES